MGRRNCVPRVLSTEYCGLQAPALPILACLAHPRFSNWNLRSRINTKDSPQHRTTALGKLQLTSYWGAWQEEGKATAENSQQSMTCAPADQERTRQYWTALVLFLWCCGLRGASITELHPQPFTKVFYSEIGCHSLPKWDSHV